MLGLFREKLQFPLGYWLLTSLLIWKAYWYLQMNVLRCFLYFYNYSWQECWSIVSLPTITEGGNLFFCFWYIYNIFWVFFYFFLLITFDFVFLLPNLFSWDSVLGSVFSFLLSYSFSEFICTDESQIYFGKAYFEVDHSTCLPIFSQKPTID